MLMNTGEKPIFSKNGLVTTIAWGLDGKVNYALEGSIFVAGSAIQWLRDQLRVLDAASDSEYFASKVSDTNGCYVVPAFTGLGAPQLGSLRPRSHRGPDPRREPLSHHPRHAGIPGLSDLRGAGSHGSRFRHQDDLPQGGRRRFCQRSAHADAGRHQPGSRQPPRVRGNHGHGAAYLAGLAVGYWKNKEDVIRNWASDKVFGPKITRVERDKKVRGWKKAVRCAYDWARDED